LTVVVIRLPNAIFKTPNAAQSLLLPRSQCVHCKHSLRIRDNIPILSFCLLKGRCHFCKQAISLLYPLMETTSLVLGLSIFMKFGFTAQGIAAFILALGLLALAYIDWKYMILPDDINLGLLWLGLFFSLFTVFQNSKDAISGAIFGYFSLWLTYWIFKLLSKKEGMGYGDFKLLAALGAWLGWQSLPIVLLVSSLTASIFSIFILIKKKRTDIPIPFGPFLALGGFFALFYYF